MPGYFTVLGWSLLILASFWGYGEALRRWLKRPEFENIGCGLTAAWGMAGVLGIAGMLMLVRLATAPVLSLVAVVGFGLAVVAGIERWGCSKKARSRPGAGAGWWPLAWLPVGLIAALAVTSAVAWPFQIDPNDDLICYLMLPEKILQTGTLIEPFNLRRAGTLGGHSFLQAMVMVVGGDRSGHVADLGLGRLMFFGVVVGLVPGRGRWPMIQRVTLGIVALLYPVPRINTMSAYTGSALLLALMQTLGLWKSERERSALAWWVPSWIICAACATLRPQFGLAAGMVFGVGWLAAWLNSRPLKVSALVHSLPLLLPPLALALPWMVVLYLSNATLFMPPWLGNVNPIFLTTGNPDVGGTLEVVRRFFWRAEVFPLVVCSSLVALSRRPLLGSAFVVASLLCSVAVASKMSATAPVEMPRYLVPLLLPAAMYALCVASWAKRAPAVVGLVACIVSLGANAPVIWEETKLRAVSLPTQLTLRMPLHPDDPNRPGTYAEGLRSLQDKIPPGRKVLAVVDFPYLLDFGRNDIVSIDSIGAAGPRGGVPLLEGADSLNRYFHDLGIEYVIMMDFEKALLLYNRNYWKNHPRPEWYYRKIWAPRFLDFMNSMDTLWLRGERLGTFYNLRALQLPPSS